MEYCHPGRECINIIAKESVKDFVDLTNVTHSKPESVRDVWIMIDDISLTVVDKTILTKNEWLTDSHIRAAQYLLQQQHPGISGFQSPTLRYTRTFAVHGNCEFVQCLHVSDNHWITISTVGCPANIVIVYDSFNSSRLSISIKKIVADFLHTNSNYITIKYAKIQFQKGTSDCGLFAVANATAICNGMDPAYLQFDQDTMREHLFERKFLSPFPAEEVERKCAVVRKEKLRIFCECRMIDDGRCMVECNRCKNWYHADCVNISERALCNKRASWYCKSCSKSPYTYERVAQEIKLLKVCHPMRK